MQALLESAGANYLNIEEFMLTVEYVMNMFFYFKNQMELVLCQHKREA